MIQTKLYELEGQVRRGAAERGVAEIKKNEFQEEIQRQKDQISHIESLYKRQLEGAQNTCSMEKVQTNTLGELNWNKMQQEQIAHNIDNCFLCSLFLRVPVSLKNNQARRSSFGADENISFFYCLLTVLVLTKLTN